MWNMLSVLQKNLVWSIPVSMLLGLLCGYLLDVTPLKQMIIPVTFIMVYPMMVTLNVQSIFKGRDTALQLATQAVNFVLIPCWRIPPAGFSSPASPKNTRSGRWDCF
jgi:ACR3 family arsenite transporter